VKFLESRGTRLRRVMAGRNLADQATVWHEEGGVAPGGKRYTDAPLELR
jgi:hypothetical protein